MNNQNCITDEMWWSICDANMSEPINLVGADISQSFVYDRKFGLFYVGSGYHQQAMSVILAFHHGFTNLMEVRTELNLKSTSEAADFWLEKIEGTAFKSSVCKKIIAWNSTNLNFSEKRIFKEIDFLSTKRY